MKIGFKYWKFILFIFISIPLVSGQKKNELEFDEIIVVDNVVKLNGIYYSNKSNKQKELSGEYKYFHINGKIKALVYFMDGIPHGNWHLFDSSGIKTMLMKYSEGEIVKKEFPEAETNYPWTKSLSLNAKNAIYKSIDNISKNPFYKGNFPTDLYNTPFVWKEKSEFMIVEYVYSTSKPQIITIGFLPGNEYKSGPRFNVEMNIVTEEALRVYMTADA